MQSCTSKCEVKKCKYMLPTNAHWYTKKEDLGLGLYYKTWKGCVVQFSWLLCICNPINLLLVPRSDSCSQWEGLQYKKIVQTFTWQDPNGLSIGFSICFLWKIVKKNTFHLLHYLELLPLKVVWILAISKACDKWSN